MSVARRVLAGLFGGASTGLQGLVAKKAREREEMRREREILSEREFQREMDATRAARDREREDRLRGEREETQRLAKEQAEQRQLRELLIGGKLIREPNSVSERVGIEMPTDGAARLEESLTGAPRPGLGLQPSLIEGQPRPAGEEYVRGSTGLGLDAGAVLGRMEQEGPTLGRVLGKDGTTEVRPSQAFNPLSIEVPDFELQRADPRTQPQRELIEMGGGIFSIPTNQEIAARQREAARGFDEIELNELQAAALGEGAEARDAQRRLANAGIDYLTPDEREDRAADRAAQQRDLDRKEADRRQIQTTVVGMIRDWQNRNETPPALSDIARMVNSVVSSDRTLSGLLNEEDLKEVTTGAAAVSEASQVEGEDAAPVIPAVRDFDSTVEEQKKEYEEALANVEGLEPYFESGVVELPSTLGQRGTLLGGVPQLSSVPKLRRLRADLTEEEMAALKISPGRAAADRERLEQAWRNSLAIIENYEANVGL